MRFDRHDLIYRLKQNCFFSIFFVRRRRSRRRRLRRQLLSLLIQIKRKLKRRRTFSSAQHQKLIVFGHYNRLDTNRHQTLAPIILRKIPCNSRS